MADGTPNISAIHREGRRARAARSAACRASTSSGSAARSTRARPCVHLPRAADPLRPLFPAVARRTLRAAAGPSSCASRWGSRSARSTARRVRSSSTICSSSFDFMGSTPTLFNAGTSGRSSRSCYPHDRARRARRHLRGDPRQRAAVEIRGRARQRLDPRARRSARTSRAPTARSQGVVPFLKVANDTAVAVNQGGKRKGAVCAYLETWHLDVEEFLELRKNTGDDRRRTHDMNTANWIPDLFMRRVEADGEWTLFSPDEVPDLHDLYGAAFDERVRGLRGEGRRAARSRVLKRVARRRAVARMLTMLFETGHPWITFKDPCNLRSPQRHVGAVHQSNLCTEITLNTSRRRDRGLQPGLGEPRDARDARRPRPRALARTVRTAVRMLDNVIDINYYTIPQARRSNLRHRPIGLGLMGFQDALYALRHALRVRRGRGVRRRQHGGDLLLRDRGLRRSGRASAAAMRASRARCGAGMLPIDSVELLAEARGGDLDVDRSPTLDWDALRERVRTVGMRNSNMHGDRADRDDLEHLRRRAVHRARVPEPLRQVEHVRRLHRGQLRTWSPISRRAGLWDEVMVDGPEVLRRQSWPRSSGSRPTSRRCTPRRSRSTRLAGRGGVRAGRSGSTRRSR